MTTTPEMPKKPDRSRIRIAEDLVIANAHKAEDDAEDLRRKLKDQARVAEAQVRAKIRHQEDEADEDKYQNDLIAAHKKDVSASVVPATPPKQPYPQKQQPYQPPTKPKSRY